MTTQMLFATCIALLLASTVRAQPTATYVASTSLPTGSSPTKMVAGPNGALVGMSAKPRNDVLLKLGTRYRSLANEVAMPAGMDTLRMQCVVMRNDEKVVVGLEGVVLSKYPDDTQWKVDTISQQQSNNRRLTFAGASSDADSVLFVVHADSIIKQEYTFGVRFETVKRHVELWSLHDDGLTLLYAFDRPENFLVIQIAPTLVNNYFYMPCKGSEVNKQMMRLGADGLVFLLTPDHETIKHNAPRATTVRSDNQLIVVYEGGMIDTDSGSLYIPSVVLTLDPLSGTSRVHEMEPQLGHVVGAAMMGEALAIATTDGLWVGSPQKLVEVDFREWTSSPSAFYKNLWSIVTTNTNTYLSTPQVFIEVTGTISSLNNDLVIDQIVATSRVYHVNEPIEFESGAWSIFTVTGAHVWTAPSSDPCTTSLSVPGVYILTDGTKTMRALVLGG